MDSDSARTRWRTDASTRVLMFHRVLAESPAAFDLPSCYRMRGTALTAAELARVLDETGPIVALAAVEAALARGEAPPLGVVLTFDDGYREHHDVVASMLAERGATATFYVSTNLHGTGSEVGVVDAWYWLLDHAVGRTASVPMPHGATYRGRIDTMEAKATWVGGEPKAALLAATPLHQAKMLDELAASVEAELPPDLAARLYMRRDEWSSLAARGMRIGAHGLSHARLTQLDADDLRAEVHGAIDAVRSCGTPVPFAYPDGAYDDRVVDEVRAAAASSSVTCDVGALHRGVDVLRLPRLFVSPSALG